MRGLANLPGKVFLSLQVLGLLIAFRILLPCFKLSRILKWLESPQIPPIADSRKLQRAKRCTNALLKWVPSWTGGKCLPRALTLYYFATRCGFPVDIHCGVRRVEGTLQGHAWLSRNGKPFLEEGSPGRTYAVTFSFPDPERASVAADNPTIETTQKP